MGIANPLEEPTQLHIVSTTRNGRLSTKLLAETVSSKNQSVSNVVEPNGSWIENQETILSNQKKLKGEEMPKGWTHLPATKNGINSMDSSDSGNRCYC